ncbi:hypothetical protein [Solitalea lacus]|uniref:hypothetical protein n=1 Tax=Solitalea lacus TaxID=2911172 RepID=UPI001EDAC1AE|nr:hypothetical protein [Solitalea lacus]UKJ06046.1 hypothetical protein L2B55_10855 [Solitalea lacus]
MTPSKKDAKKTSQKILETNIALKIKEALKDIEHGESKKVLKTIQEASKKLAKRVLKANSEIEKSELTTPTTKKPVKTSVPVKLSKTKATKVVERIKRVTPKTDSSEPKTGIEKPKITSVALPPAKKIKAPVKKSISKNVSAPKKQRVIKANSKAKKLGTDADEELGHS